MTEVGLHARFELRRPTGFHLRFEIDVDSGSTVALLGPNGAGKSTVVWALAGILPLEGGRVTLKGRVLDDVEMRIHLPPEQRRIGVVFQDVLLFLHLDVVGNVAFALGSGREAEGAAWEWLKRLGLEDLAKLRPGQLSGGQAQQVGLARALAGRPDLLLLDEPLSALDVRARAQVRRTLTEHLDAFEGPRLLITHDPAEAFLMADRVVILEEGSVTQAGVADDIRRHPATGYAADLAGVNLLTGYASDGNVEVAGGPDLRILDKSVAGPVLVTIHPRVVAIHPGPPEGSPRNAWPATISVVEPLGDCCRVQFGEPLRLTAEVTTAARHELDLREGKQFWLAIKATEISVRPA